MTIGSLFSGIGGLELGLERAGLGPVIWQAECEPFAREVLRRGEALGDTASERRDEGRTLGTEASRGRGPDADRDGAFPPRPFDRAGWDRWIARGGPEPVVRGNADGIPDRLDRLSALGNAVLPAVGEVIGRAIVAAERGAL